MNLPDSVMKIIKEVAAETGVDLDSIARPYGRDVSLKAKEARRMAVQRVREGMMVNGRAPSYRLIGRWFGYQDPTGPWWACHGGRPQALRRGALIELAA